MPAVKPDETHAYRRRVRDLTAEVCALKAQLDQERKSRSEEVSMLKAQLREGLTPELIALRKQLSSWRTRALAAEARQRAGAL